MRRSPVLVVWLTVFVDLLGFGMVVPLLPLIAKNHDASKFLATLLLAVYSLMQFLFAPMWGHLSDRVGRKPVLSLTLAGNAGAYVLFAFARDLPTLFVARGLSGFFAANISTAQAYMADVTTKENRTKAMGLVGMAFGLGFVLGPAFGALLTAKVGPWAPGAGAAILSAVACAIAVFGLPESLSPELRHRASARRAHPILSLREAMGNRSLGGLLAMFFFLVFGFANLEAVISLFVGERYGPGWTPGLTSKEAERVVQTNVGLLFVYIGVCIAFAQGFLVGRVAKRFGEARVLLVAPLLLVVGMQGYWLAPSFAWVLVAVPFVALGFGLSNPTVASLVSQRTPPDVQGRTLGLTQSLGALARAVSPGLAGLLYDGYGAAAPFAWGGAAILVGLLLGGRALGAPPAAGGDAPVA